jgi:hypothetical protein
MLRAAFKLPLRQIEALMTSVLSLMGLTISAPDHTTISRRAMTLPVIHATSVPHGPLHVPIADADTGSALHGPFEGFRTWRALAHFEDGG